MKIIRIKEEDKYFKEIINIYYEWFGKENYTLEEFYNKYKEVLVSETIPSLYALIINDTLIGMYELNEKDGIDIKKYTPYLAGVYIKENYRNNKYSELLINDAIKRANNYGYKKRYLHSRIENYYEKYGFKLIEEVKINKQIKRIYERETIN